MTKILTIFGTRPEAIKLAPVVKELSKFTNQFESFVGLTGQHDELLRQVCDIFSISTDFNLGVMKTNQDLTTLTATILKELERKIQDLRPDMIIIQGDTTTVFAAALAAFHNRVAVAHVEAGLRTQDKYNPYPEEIYRRLTDQISDLCFAPTEISRLNLLMSGIPDHRIFVTGNTVVDSLLEMCSRENGNGLKNVLAFPEGKTILCTAHRRENFGEPINNVFRALKRLSEDHSDFHFVVPVHPNPHVKRSATKILSGTRNVHLTPPLDYFSFIQLMKRCYLILTDSGGIQEEAPSLKKPVLILRTKTERPEVVDAGAAKLVGTDVDNIVREVNRLIVDPDSYKAMSKVLNPFGDGTASQKIVQVLRNYF
jgi:UDP-N-acetylglucosamine 2-epimerase (non-hydrolysing)